MNKIFLTGIFALILNYFSFAQDLQDPLPYLKKFTDDYLNTYKNQEYISAIALTAQCKTSQGNTYLDSAYSGTLGFGSIYPENTPLQKNDVFQIGSVTKSFIAVVLLQLEGSQVVLPNGEEHIFSIDDPINLYFPEYNQWHGKIDDNGIYHAVVVRQLLNMTSGVPSYTGSKAFLQDAASYPYNYISKQNILDYVSSLPLEFVPGSKYEYSNTNFTLAGILIEKITHNNLEKEIKERIINKLNLNHTFFPKNFAYEVYSYNFLVHGYDEENIPYPLHTDITNYSLSWANSAGAIISNTLDINTYIHALFNPGLLLNKTQIQKLITSEPGIVAQDDENVIGYYGLGIFKGYMKKTKESFFSYEGGTFGFRFYYIYFPTHALSIVSA